MTYQYQQHRKATVMLLGSGYATIDMLTPNINGCYEKYETLTSVRFYGTIAQGEQDDTHDGNAANRILDREAGVRNTTNALYNGDGLDQSWNVPGLSSWRTMESQKTRNGGMGAQPEKYLSTTVTTKRKASTTLADGSSPPMGGT